MKGDFSRIRFTPGQHFTSVLQQQGRVSLDADANEQCAIDEYLRTTQIVDTIGATGGPGPADNAGFEIKVDEKTSTIRIGKGHYYVQGLLCESSGTDYMDQPYLIAPSETDADLLGALAAAPGSAICVELQAWQRLVTALDDPCLLEPALGQADTTARLQTVWRVVARSVGTAGERSSVVKPAQAGKLCVQLSKTGDDCSCQPIPPAGYQGLENQLYRIEIHQPGNEQTATFKWSRENASIVAAITGSSSTSTQTTIQVDSLGKDANLGFGANQWVEISDDTKEFGDPPNQHGTFYQISSVSAAGQPPSITFTTAFPASNPPYNPACHPRVRRWDQPGTVATGDTLATGDMPLPVNVNAPGPIENGIEITFSPGNYNSGDYWLIPARTASGTIDWPPCGSDGNCCQPAANIPVYTAPLALITEISKVKPLARITETPKVPELAAISLPILAAIRVQDLRSFFQPLSSSAMHIEKINWLNDELMTLDQLLTEGLQLLLDRVPTGQVDASVFRVSLEIPQFRIEDETFQSQAPAAPTNQPVQGAAPQSQASSNATAASILQPELLRQEYVLDGVVTVEDSVLAWSLRADKNIYKRLVYQLNDLLQVSYAPNLAWYPRVRVRLFGHMIYLQTASTSGQCGQTKTLFLDGQCFGKPGQRGDNTPRIALTYPSGNSAVASDFESWFYLAPMPEVEDVIFENASVPADANGQAQNSGTVMLEAPVVTAATIALVASLTSATGAAVPSTIMIASTITIAAGSTTSPAFTINVQLAAGASGGPFTCTVTATPQLTSGTGALFSGQGSFSVYELLAISTLSLPPGTVGVEYNATLSATGGTSPYSWSIPSGGLPTGLTLNQTNGVISGRPTTATQIGFPVRVTDSASPPATVTQEFTITIVAYGYLGAYGKGTAIGESML